MASAYASGDIENSELGLGGKGRQHRSGRLSRPRCVFEGLRHLIRLVIGTGRERTSLRIDAQCLQRCLLHHVVGASS